MSMESHELDRRHFLKTAAGLGVGAVGAAKLQAEDKKEDAAKPDEKNLDVRTKVPTMEYRRLGRTNYLCSRIVAGYAGGPDLWRRLLSRGVNYWDTGRGYGNHEVELKPFLKEDRDKLWITSKATGVAGYDKVDDGVRELYLAALKAYLGDKFNELNTAYGQDKGKDLLRFHAAALEKEKATGQKPDFRPAGKRMAELYAAKLDESLSRMGIDHVDCYFMHGVEIPWLWQCTEVWDAYEKARKAGKVKHFGFSAHKHQKEVMAAGVEANEKGPWKIDLIMPGVNPESFDDLKPELAAFKKQDVGIIAMKTSGIKNRPVDGREKKFETLMGQKQYNEWERAKLWMLHLTDGLVDACIAGMKSNEEMAKDLALATVKLSAEARRELRSLVKYEMAGACHLCGACETNCPEHIAVTDMIRYHAYIHQYHEKEMARELYAQAGYDPAKVCTSCGHCAEACKSGVEITRILNQLSVDLA